MTNLLNIPGSTFFKDTLFGGGGVQGKSNDTVFFMYAERYLSNYLITNVQFFNQAKAGTTIHFADDSKLKYVGELESYSIDGIEYRNVRVFENLIVTEDRLPWKIYYAKGIGVIRKELFNGQVWNLKRYFINN